MVTHFASGSYRSLTAPGRPFSSGIVADAGFDLVRAVFIRPLPLDQGLAAARRHVEAAGRPVTSIAGFELRIPEQLSREAFDAFNVPYVERMTAMGLANAGEMVTTRTNVAPVASAVAEPSVYAVTYTVPGGPGGRPRTAFRLSGATETTSEGTAADRLRSIVAELEGRMAELGVGWEDATAITVYGDTTAACELDPDVMARFGAAALGGLRWFPSRPPIRGLAFEIDAHGVGAELSL